MQPHFLWRKTAELENRAMCEAGVPAETLHIPSCLLFPMRHRSERMRRLNHGLIQNQAFVFTCYSESTCHPNMCFLSHAATACNSHFCLPDIQLFLCMFHGYRHAIRIFSFVHMQPPHVITNYVIQTFRCSHACLCLAILFPCQLFFYVHLWSSPTVLFGGCRRKVFYTT